MVENLKTGYHPKIFISHASDEQILADAWKKLIATISSGYIQVWFSSDESPVGGMTLGNRWFDELYIKITESELVLAIQTSVSASRPWIMWECGIASGVDKQRGILPIVYTMKREDLALPLSTYQVYQGDNAKSVREVCQRLIDRFTLATADFVYDVAIKEYLDRINLHFSNNGVSTKSPRKKVSPEQITFWQNRFEDYVQSGRISEINTQRRLMYARLEKPVDLAIHTMLGQLLVEHEKFREALEEIHYALEFAPDNIVLLHLKALTLVELHQLTLAEQVIDTILSMDSDLDKNAEIASVKGRIYRERWRETGDLGNLDKAIEAYYKAYKPDQDADDKEESYYMGINVAELAFLKGEEVFAIEIVQKVLETCQQLQTRYPVSYWVDFSAGQAYLGLGEIDRARTEYEKGLRRKPAPGPRELSSALGGISRMVVAKKLSNEVIDDFVVKIKTLFKLS